ncbi:Rhodanese-like protein [[Leptolyngbya] sp. PCC 7376]|uniref:rhodanese-like domain-containing protein n=1 Tax=[Leptolyngbya] sp. PCC 7376 TaxID=111781 RepID=UPI00029F4901|nr:rhodanese-like domain-containing protein [[Leptolyngbya] sp. PCC 7376]AFY39157.1 Rhodanese-like protein [[Leptolyngbya] sp. PCC 7376]
MTTPIQEISVQAFAEKVAIAAELEQDLQFIDVREPQEVAIAVLDGFQTLSLSQFEEWSPTISEDFDPNTETYVLCHHGIRSAQMCQWLQQNGFTNVINIMGGIDAYSLLVDRNVPRY